MQQTGKIPPQAVEIEQIVLGAMLISGSEVTDKVTQIIRPDDLYKESHVLIFQAILKLYRDNQNTDLYIVNEELTKNGNIEKIGGLNYLMQLTEKIVSVVGIEQHCYLIKQKSIARQLIRLGNDIIQQSFDAFADVADLIAFASNGLERITDSIYEKKTGNSFADYIKQSIDEYNQREEVARRGGLHGVPTGVHKLNKISGGWQGGELTIIAARPSMGKTAFALHIVKTAALDGNWVNIYSLEMRGVRLTDRILTGQANIDPSKFRDGYLDVGEKDQLKNASEQLKDLPVFIDDNPMTNMEYIRARSRILKRKGQCDMIVIDYLQLIDNDETSTRGRNREQEVSEMSRKAKLLALELNVPVILLSQLNRACELRGGLKKPELSDLRESGAIEQDADNVILMWRGERYGIIVDEEGNSIKGKGELIVAKQRNGSIGTVFFGYNESLTRIYDWYDPSKIPVEAGVDLFLEDANIEPMTQPPLGLTDPNSSTNYNNFETDRK